MDPCTGYVFWRLSVPAVHELVVTHDGKRTYVIPRRANELAVADLENQIFENVLTTVSRQSAVIVNDFAEQRGDVCLARRWGGV